MIGIKSGSRQKTVEKLIERFFERDYLTELFILYRRINKYIQTTQFFVGILLWKAIALSHSILELTLLESIARINISTSIILTRQQTQHGVPFRAMTQFISLYTQLSKSIDLPLL